MGKITYIDKVQHTANPLPDVNKVTAGDMNQIKNVVNGLDDDKSDRTGNGNMSVSGSTIDLSNKANRWINYTGVGGVLILPSASADTGSIAVTIMNDSSDSGDLAVHVAFGGVIIIGEDGNLTGTSVVIEKYKNVTFYSDGSRWSVVASGLARGGDVVQGGFTRMPFKTGHVLSTATGDDADTQMGQDIFTLPIIEGNQQLNHFGNKWRFTGIAGGYYDQDTSQFKSSNGTVLGTNLTAKNLAFPNALVIDNLTRDWNDDVLMFYCSNTPTTTNLWFGVPSLTWSEACSYGDDVLNIVAPSGFDNGWDFANDKQVYNLTYKGAMTYEPFAQASSQEIMTSSNASIAPGDSFSISNYLSVNVWRGGISDKPKSSAAASDTFAIFVRITNLSEL